MFQALKVKLSRKEMMIADRILREIRERLDFLLGVGVEYLTLDRRSDTLAGGEEQRVRLATQIGSGLVGVLYILDEPSIGLHQRDNRRLLHTLHALRDLGNTVLVVEHDKQTILSADWVIDLGPGAGEDGGKVVATGTPEEIRDCIHSLTGAYLGGKKKIDVPKRRRRSKKRKRMQIRRKSAQIRKQRKGRMRRKRRANRTKAKSEEYCRKAKKNRLGSPIARNILTMMFIINIII